MEHLAHPPSYDRLANLLDRMRRKAPSLASKPLVKLDAAISRDDEAGLASLLPELREACPEEAVERLRHPGFTRTEGMKKLLKALEPSATAARAKRAARAATDAARTRVRLRVERNAPLLDLDSQDLQVLFSEAFYLEGLPLAMDLGRHPKPLMAWAPPLSPNVAGCEEVVEAELQSAPPEGWLAQLNGRLPEGMRAVSACLLPPWATPALDLAFRADYVWPCPLQEMEARHAMDVFLSAPAFFLEKPGKVAGIKSGKKVDVRPEVLEADWMGASLCFSMPLRPGKALNPLKLLGAIFGVEPATLSGLTRLRIHLKEDPRNGNAGRFETKLKNLYEDATLLTAGGNITLMDEDDGEPIVLG